MESYSREILRKDKAGKPVAAKQVQLALQDHFKDVYSTVVKVIQSSLLGKVKGEACRDFSGDNARLGGDLTKVVDLTKAFIKAAKIKINPECPICWDDIAPEWQEEREEGRLTSSLFCPRLAKNFPRVTYSNDRSLDSLTIKINR